MKKMKPAWGQSQAKTTNPHPKHARYEGNIFRMISDDVLVNISYREARRVDLLFLLKKFNQLIDHTIEYGILGSFTATATIFRGQCRVDIVLTIK